MKEAPQEIITRLEDIFDQAVESVSFLMSDDTGLDVRFVNDSADSIEWTPQIYNRNQRRQIIDMAQEFRVVACHGVYSNFLYYKGEMVSEGRTEEGTLLQDPFHRDDFGEGDTHAGILLKNYMAYARPCPTYFSPTKAVQAGIQALLVDDNYSHKINAPVRAALTCMAEESYGFLNKEKDALDHEPQRRCVRVGYESYMADVWRKIPEDQKYAHQWRVGEVSLVIFCNQRGGILHGRPSGTDKYTDTFGKQQTGHSLVQGYGLMP